MDVAPVDAGEAPPTSEENAYRSYDPGKDPPWYWRPVYAPVDDEMLLRHLGGTAELGTYALIPSGGLPTVRWIGADFDGKRPGSDWESDVKDFLSFILDSGATILLNRSRSGQGAHVRALFREPVPAWMARRWMQAYLEEAGVVSEVPGPIPTSFDRLCPPQDTLLEGRTYDNQRRPGNLFGMPMHRGRAESCGGTLPISPESGASGDFEPDGKHWEHLVKALDARSWNESDLRTALADAPGRTDLNPPTGATYGNRALVVLQGEAAEIPLLITRRHCAFFQYLQAGGDQPYSLWIALASQLHHFGEAGREAFHELSALDHRYNASSVQRKWDQTSDMRPMKCETLVDMGWRCPNLGTRRCNGARTPAYFSEHTNYDPL